MAEPQKNIRTHYWYQKRFHIRLADEDISKDWIFAPGVEKIHEHIADKGHLDKNWLTPVGGFVGEYGGVWHDPYRTYERNGLRPVSIADFGNNVFAKVDP